MKKQMYLWLVLSIATLVISGCQTTTDLVEIEQSNITNHSPGKVKIQWSKAQSKDEQFFVTGTVKRVDRSASPIMVHIHVLEIDQNKHILQSIESEPISVLRPRVGRGSDWKRFALSSTTLPQQNSDLHVFVHTHNEPHTNEELIASHP